MKSGRQFFRDQVIWITGASSGIGEALAYAFAEQGAKLILSSRKEDRLRQVASCCKGAGGILILPLDLCEMPELPEKASIARARWGRIDLMVHNAGQACRALAGETPLDIDRRIMELNYFGPVALTKYILPGMLKQGSGRIVVVSSLSGKFGVPRLSAYSAAKHALHGFFESLRMELRNSGIGISVVVPGFVNTAIIQNAIDARGIPGERNLGVNEKGISPRKCAMKILRAVRNGKYEAPVGGMEILSVWMYRFFPRFYLDIISSHPVRRLRRLLHAFSGK